MCRPHSGHHGSRTVRRHQIRDRQFSPKGSRKQCPALGDQLARGARADEGAGELGRGIPRSEWFLSYSLQLQPAMPGSAAGECQDVAMLRPWGTHSLQKQPSGISHAKSHLPTDCHQEMGIRCTRAGKGEAEPQEARDKRREEGRKDREERGGATNIPPPPHHTLLRSLGKRPPSEYVLAHSLFDGVHHPPTCTYLSPGWGSRSS